MREQREHFPDIDLWHFYYAAHHCVSTRRECHEAFVSRVAFREFFMLTREASMKPEAVATRTSLSSSIRHNSWQTILLNNNNDAGEVVARRRLGPPEECHYASSERALRLARVTQPKWQWSPAPTSASASQLNGQHYDR